MRYVTRALVALSFTLGTTVVGAQQNVIGPNGVRQPSPGDQAGDWVRDQQFGAYIDVTTTNPRAGFNGYASGSLQMSVPGTKSDGTYPAWGFYYDYAKPGTSGFGKLSELSNLSFDWYRSQVQDWSVPPTKDQQGNTIPAVVDWPYKTPVIRLVIQDKNNNLSELIWEGYYNQDQLGNAPTPGNTWVTTSNIQNGSFWYATPPTSTGTPLQVGNAACQQNTFNFWQGAPNSSAIQQLTSGNGCLAGLDAVVIGLGVGVGNNWPLAWTGFVDNVRLGFGEGGSNCSALEIGCAIDANFDFVPNSTVPEPSTYLLMAVGLGAVGIIARRRRKP